MSDINRNKGESATVYRTFEDGYVVRAMTPSDIDIVVGWNSGMGSISHHNLATALAVFPPGPGFYIGELDGEVIRLVGRKTRGGEGYAWRRGRHLEGRATPGGESDTWRGGRHLGHRTFSYASCTFTKE